MKIWKWILSIAIIVLVVIGLTREAKVRHERRLRAEGHLLHTIAGNLMSHLDLGGQLPTNWISLSNSIDWDLVSGICEHNNLPPLRQSYVTLSHPVTNDRLGGFTFLVASKPSRSPGGLGRWALVVSPVKATSETNYIMPDWLPEDFLPQEIRSQLTNR